MGGLPVPRASRPVIPRTIEPFASPARMAPSLCASSLPAMPEWLSTVRPIPTSRCAPPSGATVAVGCDTLPVARVARRDRGDSSGPARLGGLRTGPARSATSPGGRVDVKMHDPV
jgi:hypothetical protein